MNPTNTYPVFENSQVLTSSQLNQLSTYLDQQDRLTRARLIGMGIVCGLELSYSATPASNIKISVGKGTGLTSEGFLITLPACETAYFRPYILPPGSHYEPFENPALKTQDVTLFEIITKLSAPANNEEKLFSAFDDDGIKKLEDYVVLLFLEIFDKDLKSCFGKTCDDIGIDRIITLRKLLISKTELVDKVLTRSGNVEGLYPDKYDLPVLSLRKPLFDASALNSSDYTEFSKNYAAAITEAYPKLFQALDQTYDIYEPLLAKTYNNNNPFTSATVQNLKTRWEAFFNGTVSPGAQYLGIQYLYDFMKDLTDAYNEFREVSFNLMSECCPDMSRFPRHLMLGEAVPVQACRPSELRHGFVQPPIYNLQKYTFEKALSLHRRLVGMLESFDLDGINNPPVSPGRAVRITPSKEKQYVLSVRSLPYYYDITKAPSVAAVGSLEKNWNYDVSRRCPGDSKFLLSYRNQADSQSVPVNHVQTPLFYETDQYPFFRIEGQIGRSYTEVKLEIEDIIKKKNLPFKIEAVKLDKTLEVTEVDYDCGFEDLQEEYIFLRDSLSDFIDSLKSLYALVKENADDVLGSKGKLTTEEMLKKLEELLGLFEKLYESLPVCLHDLDFKAFQDNYKAVLEQVIGFVLVDLQLLDEVDFDQENGEKQIPMIQRLMNIASKFLYDFIDLLFYRKLLRLYFSFSGRAYWIGTRNNHIFSSLLGKHPGAEHQAGVYKGGTFFLLYTSSADTRVIGDFSLPYLCCCEDTCVPMCGEEKEKNVKIPPFARPDYAVTLADTPLDIIVLDNDKAFYNRNIAISKTDETSKEGGIVKFNGGESLNYAPATGFAGYDYFSYSIKNEETGEEDTGKVTVLVKRIKVNKGCYSAAILECWGEENVNTAVTIRKLGSSTMPFSQKVSLLLDSLSATGGFTQAEIGGSILEPPQAREQLLSCLGISHSGKYQEMGELILKYQGENCGRMSTQIAGRVSAVTGAPIAGASVVVKGSNTATASNSDGTYQIMVQDPNDVLVFTASGFAILEEAVKSRTTINVTLLTRLRVVAVDPDKLVLTDSVKILKSRGISISNPDDKTEVGRLLAENPVLTQDEAKLLEKESLINTLGQQNIEFNKNAAKTELISILFR